MIISGKLNRRGIQLLERLTKGWVGRVHLFNLTLKHFSSAKQFCLWATERAEEGPIRKISSLLFTRNKFTG